MLRARKALGPVTFCQHLAYGGPFRAWAGRRHKQSEAHHDLPIKGRPQLPEIKTPPRSCGLSGGRLPDRPLSHSVMICGSERPSSQRHSVYHFSAVYWRSTKQAQLSWGSALSHHSRPVSFNPSSRHINAARPVPIATLMSSLPRYQPKRAVPQCFGCSANRGWGRWVEIPPPSSTSMWRPANQINCAGGLAARGRRSRCARR